MSLCCGRGRGQQCVHTCVRQREATRHVEHVHLQGTPHAARRKHMLHTDYLRVRLRLAVLQAAEVPQEGEQKELVH